MILRNSANLLFLTHITVIFYKFLVYYIIAAEFTKQPWLSTNCWTIPKDGELRTIFSTALMNILHFCFASSHHSLYKLVDVQNITIKEAEKRYKTDIWPLSLKFVILRLCALCNIYKRAKYVHHVNCPLCLYLSLPFILWKHTKFVYIILWKFAQIHTYSIPMLVTPKKVGGSLQYSHKTLQE